MLRELRKASPWIAVFVLSLVVGIGATRAARHCLLHRQGLSHNLGMGVVHRVGVSFLGLRFCERAGTVSLRSTVF